MEDAYKSIEEIRTPADVKAIPQRDIPAFCADARAFLVEKTLQNGGHLASNLGVVELTVALHRVFETPKDVLIFDVGHQCYTHKILTGRAKDFDGLRRENGISGFPSRSESAHDAFGTGHSSTSLSAALGFAEAMRLEGKKDYTVAVVGDGAFTGGMIHEAMNNCRRDLRLIVVLNDNDMSISRNIGLLPRYFSRIRVSRKYNGTKRKAKAFLSRLPLLGRPLAAFFAGVKNFIKRRVYAHNYFEELGFTYLGPVDGHDEAKLEKCLREAKAREGLVLLHCITKKGKGYAPAEENPVAFHGVSGKEACHSFHSVAGETLLSLADADEALCAVTAAMEEGTGLAAFAAKHPQRFFDVGIAEAHAVTFSAGLAAAGKKPYFAVYSTFLQRAYDNVLHDVALQGLPVRFLIDRAGFAKADGPTHHGIFDVAFLSHIPHIKLWEPSCYGVLREMLKASVNEKSPLAIRYPNDKEDEALCKAFYPEGDYAAFGARERDTASASVILVSYGKAASLALRVKELLDERTACGMVLLECLKPYEAAAEAVLAAMNAACPKAPVFFLEENIREGGAGMLLEDTLRRKAPSVMQERAYRILAPSDSFTPSLDGAEALSEQIYKSLQSLFMKNS